MAKRRRTFILSLPDIYGLPSSELNENAMFNKTRNKGVKFSNFYEKKKANILELEQINTQFIPTDIETVQYIINNSSGEISVINPKNNYLLDRLLDRKPYIFSSNLNDNIVQKLISNGVKINYGEISYIINSYNIQNNTI